MDYIKRRAAARKDGREEIVEEASEKHDYELPTTTIESCQKEVEGVGDNTQDMVEMGCYQETESSAGRENTTESDAYIRNMSFSIDEQQPDTPEKFKDVDAAKERLAEIEMVNEELKRCNSRRRYIPTKTDAPDDRHVYQDGFGKYYYQQLSDVKIRPSDVAEYSDVKAIQALDKQDKVVKTVEMLAELYGEPLNDAVTMEAAKSWLDSHMVLTDDSPGDNDTFSHQFKESVASTICEVNARQVGGKGKSKQQQVDEVPPNANNIQSPDQAPDDAEIIQGPQGGLYYVSEQGGSSSGEESPVSETMSTAAEAMGAEELTSVAHMEGMGTPEGETADEIMSEVVQNYREQGDADEAMDLVDYALDEAGVDDDAENAMVNESLDGIDNAYPVVQELMALDGMGYPDSDDLEGAVDEMLSEFDPEENIMDADNSAEYAFRFVEDADELADEIQT